MAFGHIDSRTKEDYEQNIEEIQNYTDCRVRPFVDKPIKMVKDFYLVQLVIESMKKDNKIDFINAVLFSELWNNEAYMTGIVKRGGWIFDFSTHWKNYLVKTKYNGWREMKAPNKTYIRKQATHPSEIIAIKKCDDKFLNKKVIKFLRKVSKDKNYKEEALELIKTISS